MEACNLEVGLTPAGEGFLWGLKFQNREREYECVRTRTHKHACIQSRADDKVLAQLPSLSTYIFETVSLTLDLIGLARPSSQRAPRIHLSLSPQHWDSRSTPAYPAFYMNAGRGGRTHSKYFIHRATSLAAGALSKGRRWNHGDVLDRCAKKPGVT